MANLGHQISFTLIWRYPLDFTTPARLQQHIGNVREIVRLIEGRHPDEAERLVRHTWDVWRDNAVLSLSRSRQEAISPGKLFRSV